jgi:sulfur carrier protein ThiS
MQITFKLYANLTDYLPVESRVSNRVTLEIASDATIAKIIEPFRLPTKLVHLVLINGVYVPLDQLSTKTLVEGDVLAIWPPVAGG